MEDAIRIMTQWNDQLLYLKDYRHSKIYSNHYDLLTAVPKAGLIDCQYHGASHILSYSSMSSP